PQPQEAISQTEVLAKKPEHIVAGTLPIPKAVKEVPSPTEGSLVQKQSMIQKVIEERLDFAVESFASQIKALGKGILALVNALIENDKISIEHALNYVSEDLINSLVANKVIRIEDSYIKLNLDRKLEETLDRTPSITQVLVAKRKLKQLLESQ
ncbi:MAG: hypothetical protein NDP23_04885, partial [Crenarchaeota archaeon]|nr:hypothetical protein [Thermoproteota archaeon]